MLVGILSDSHDNLPNLGKAIAHLEQQGVRALLHCGDICTVETTATMATLTSLPTHIVFGNGDYDQEGMQALAKQYKNLFFYGDTGELTLDGLSIAWNHYPEVAERLAATGKYWAVFHGHTHIPWEKKIGSCIIRNPGTVAGLRNKATCAILDTATNVARLIILERL